MARALPQDLVDQLRGLHLVVAGSGEAAADVALDLAPERIAVRVPEDRPRRLFLDVEEIHLTPQPPMVAPLGLLELVQMGVELLAAGEGDPVDPLQLRVLGVATPIGARHLHQLEGADPAGGRPVRPPAEVEPVALVVECDGLALRDGVEQLELESLAQRLEAPASILAAHLLAPEGPIGGDDLGHARLDPRKVVGRERLLAEEIVIVAVIDRRPDRHLGPGEQILDGFRHDMRTVVPDHRQRVRILTTDQSHPGVRSDRPVQVPELAVDLGHESGASQALADRGSDLGTRHAAGKAARGLVREGDGRVR